MSMKRTKAMDKFISDLEGVKVEMEEQLGNKQDSYDSKSEKWQESEKGEEAQQDISTLEDIVNDLTNALDNMQSLFPDE